MYMLCLGNNSSISWYAFFIINFYIYREVRVYVCIFLLRQALPSQVREMVMYSAMRVYKNIKSYILYSSSITKRMNLDFFRSQGL